MCCLQVPHSRVVVVTDDLDLPPGVIRLRARGGHGGHNGMRSIVQHLGGQTDFARLRIGGWLHSMYVCRRRLTPASDAGAEFAAACVLPRAHQIAHGASS